MLIYKIFLPSQWQALEADGSTRGAPIDLSDGFIHFSTGEQVRETVALHFAGQGDLVIAAVEADGLGADLKWESSRGGALFPHLFRELRMGDIAWSADLPASPEGHIFPDNVDGGAA